MKMIIIKKQMVPVTSQREILGESETGTFTKIEIELFIIIKGVGESKNCVVRRIKMLLNDFSQGFESNLLGNI
jgi:hypothetical protein